MFRQGALFHHTKNLPISRLRSEVSFHCVCTYLFDVRRRQYFHAMKRTLAMTNNCVIHSVTCVRSGETGPPKGAVMRINSNGRIENKSANFHHALNISLETKIRAKKKKGSQRVLQNSGLPIPKLTFCPRHVPLNLSGHHPASSG